MTTTPGPGVSTESIHTLTNANVFAINYALGINTTPDIAAGCDTALDQVVRIAGEARLALTSRFVPHGETIGVRPANGRMAGIDANPRLSVTHCVIGAVMVGFTFGRTEASG